MGARDPKRSAAPPGRGPCVSLLASCAMPCFCGGAGGGALLVVHTLFLATGVALPLEVAYVYELSLSESLSLWSLAL